jgi:hypothetical protein
MPFTPSSEDKEMKSKWLLVRSCGLLALGRALLLAAALTLSGFDLNASAHASDWALGDVFAGVSNGSYKVYDNAGVFKETVIDGLGGYTTGCAFNVTGDKFYTTDLSAGKLVVFDNTHPHAIQQTITTGDIRPESIVFDGMRNFYVGHGDGTNHTVKKFDTAGSSTGSFSPAIETLGTDWIELAADQCTIFYTSEGRKIKRFNLCSNTQLPDFADIGGQNFALRLLSPFDGSGGLLVANSATIKRLDSSGAVTQTYDATGQDKWFALTLDPNGTSFWSGSFDTGSFFRFNINSGTIEVGPVIAANGGEFFGLCVKGEIVGAARAIPTLTDWTQIIMVGLLIASSLWVLRRWARRSP